MQMKALPLFGLPLAVLVLSGCTVLPTGPSVMALPGTGKNFDQFRADDASCRQYAYVQVGGVTADQASTNSAVASAVVGTALGAAAGAAFGGGEGAAIGAGAGLLTGSAIGYNNAAYSGYGSQQRYDAAYIQCMYASGNKVPVYGHMATQMAPHAGTAYYRPAPPPPPPPGYYGAPAY